MMIKKFLLIKKKTMNYQNKKIMKKLYYKKKSYSNKHK